MMWAMRTAPRTKPGTKFSRAIAISGIFLLASPFLFLGAISWFNYNGWMNGRDRYPIVAWFSAWFGISGVFSIAVAYIIAGSSGVDRFGGVGTVIMLAGGVVGAAATWWFDQAAAVHPTLKDSGGSEAGRPLFLELLRIVGLMVAGIGIGLAVVSFVTNLFPEDSTLRASIWLVPVGGGLYFVATYGFTSTSK
jgi:hypothetical protein